MHPYDEILDPFCWAHFYAGEVFLEGKKPPPPPGCQRHCYVVLEDSANPHDRLPMMAVAVPLAQQGQHVYHWEPAQPAKDQPGINIFRVPPE